MITDFLTHWSFVIAGVGFATFMLWAAHVEARAYRRKARRYVRRVK